MSAHLAPVRRVIGFRPWEISALINRGVLEEHASEAGFLWSQRNHAVHAPHYKLKHLAKLDARVLAHLEGLRVAGIEGWRAARQALAHASAGPVFVAAYLAFASQDAANMSRVLQLGLTEPSYGDALLAGLAWHDASELHEVLDSLAASPAAEHRRIALATRAAHRIVTGSEVVRGAQDADGALRARALRAIGETKARDLFSMAQQGLHDSDPACRFWAGWSLALLGDPTGAPAALDASRALPSLRRDALEVAMRFGEPGWAREVIRSLARAPDTRRAAIHAAGAFGDPTAIPWLLEHLDDPLHARVAGEAFSSITGADLDYLDLKREAPDNTADGSPEDADVPWPQAAVVRAWWQQQRSRFFHGHRYIAGHPVSPAAALYVLREGYQRQRQGAALELTRLSDQAIVFSVVARADWQRQRLAA